MSVLPPDAVQPLSRAEWGAWLATNASSSKGVWLVSFKRSTGRPRIEYEAAVEEALCWGWIDSVTRSLDAERTLLRFTPRKKGSVWADSNKERLARLEAQGRLQPVAFALIEAAKADGSWSRYDEAEQGIVPPDLRAALEGAGALANFEAFPPGERKRFLGWIAGAKTAATRERRIAQAAERCRHNLRLEDAKPKENQP